MQPRVRGGETAGAVRANAFGWEPSQLLGIASGQAKTVGSWDGGGLWQAVARGYVSLRLLDGR